MYRDLNRSPVVPFGFMWRLGTHKTWWSIYLSLFRLLLWWTLILLASSWWKDESLGAVKKCCCATIVRFTTPTVGDFFFLNDSLQTLIGILVAGTQLACTVSQSAQRENIKGSCAYLRFPLFPWWDVTCESPSFWDFIIGLESNLKEAAWLVGLVYYLWEFWVIFPLVFCHFSRGSLTLLLSHFCSGNSNFSLGPWQTWLGAKCSFKVIISKYHSWDVFVCWWRAEGLVVYVCIWHFLLVWIFYAGES